MKRWVARGILSAVALGIVSLMIAFLWYARHEFPVFVVFVAAGFAIGWALDNYV